MSECSHTIKQLVHTSKHCKTFKHITLSAEDCPLCKIDQLTAERDELRDAYDTVIKHLYGMLGVDGSDGEYRFKWVAVALKNVLTERDKYKEEADRRTMELELTYNVQKELRDERDKYREALEAIECLETDWNDLERHIAREALK